MKIVISANSTWNLINFRIGLIKALINKNYQVVCLIPRGDSSDVLRDLGVRIREISIDPTGTNILAEIRYFINLSYILYKESPNYYFGFTIKPNIYGALISKFFGIKAILNITGLGSSFLRRNLLTKITFFLYKIAFSSATFVFFQNKDDQQLFYKNKILLHNRTKILPGSGVDLKKFSRKYIPSVSYEFFNKNSSDSDFKFLLISRLLADKGIYEFIESIKVLKRENRKFTALIIGAIDGLNSSGIDQSELNHWISHGLIIHYNFIDDVRPFIFNADCVVLPSYREGTPKSLLEAGAMGKPLITTNVPGCKDVIDDGVNGFICKSRSSEDLAKAMRKVLSMDKKILDTFGEESYKKISNEYDENIVHKMYLNVIN